MDAITTDDNTLLIVGVSAVCLLVGGYFVFFSGPPSVLPKKNGVFEKYPLIKKDIVSHDTRKFTFGLPAGHVLGLPTGQHMTLKCKDPADPNKTVLRSYTPVTDNTSVGEVSFVIKVYKAGVHPKFPDGGKMSQYLDSLQIGDMIDMKGPKGHMDYKKGGKFEVKPLGKPKEYRSTTNIIMIAGGTGITPMLQILQFIFKRPGDTNAIKNVRLLYANQSEDDILVRSELEALEKEFPGQFKLHYTLDRPPKGGKWEYSTGFISKEMIEKYCLVNGSNKDTQVFMCGPPPMIKFACLPNLQELGFTEKEWVIF